VSGLWHSGAQLFQLLPFKTEHEKALRLTHKHTERQVIWAQHRTEIYKLALSRVFHAHSSLAARLFVALSHRKSQEPLGKLNRQVKSSECSCQKYPTSFTPRLPLFVCPAGCGASCPLVMFVECVFMVLARWPVFLLPHTHHSHSPTLIIITASSKRLMMPILAPLCTSGLPVLLARLNPPPSSYRSTSF